MKTLLALCLLLFVIPLQASDVKLAWDNAADWPTDTVVRIYERASGVDTLKATSTPLATQVSIPAVASGAHTYFARAYSASLGIESGDSNAVEAKVLVPPGNLKYTIVITIGN